MGILIANLPGFALPQAAYFSPLAWGGTRTADLIAWFATFVLVEGKMRGLFGLLFGASMLLVIDHARAAGQSAASVHYSRMAVLFVIGVAHLYLVWDGDILAHYALVGSVAFVFASLSVRWLIGISVVLIGYHALVMGQATMALFDSAARDTPKAIATWSAFARDFGQSDPATLTREIAALRSPVGAVGWRWDTVTGPITSLEALWPDTLAAMLIGMAAFRSGMLTGAWAPARYRRWAVVGVGVTLPLYVVLATLTMQSGFDQRWVFFGSLLASVPLRMVTAVGYAAALLLVFRRFGWLGERVAAVGRTAFTNYLGTSLLMAGLFTGMGQFGRWGRAELYILVPVVWAIMLTWSMAWLSSYRLGPFEWVWRSAARWEISPMRRSTRTLN